jgi:excisionase family DNA binding protein
MNINRSKTPTKFYTIAQIAEFMDNHERSVRRWIKRGWLVAHRVNRLVRISEADFLSPSRSAGVRRCQPESNNVKVLR